MGRMKCPTDEVDLVMAERQGIEIDYCPKCRGVWLDRGELDKIIERSVPAAAAPQQAPDYRRQEPPRHGEYRDDDKPHHGEYRHKKRKSFLGEIFDF